MEWYTSSRTTELIEKKDLLMLCFSDYEESKQTSERRVLRQRIIARI